MNDETTKRMVTRPSDERNMWVQAFDQTTGELELCVVISGAPMPVCIVVGLTPIETERLVLDLVNNLPSGRCRKFLKEHKQLFNSWRTETESAVRKKATKGFTLGDRRFTIEIDLLGGPSRNETECTVWCEDGQAVETTFDPPAISHRGKPEDSALDVISEYMQRARESFRSRAKT